MTFEYVDTAVGGAMNRNTPRKLSPWLASLAKKDESELVDVFATYFRYPETFKNHVEETGSVKGYDGPIAPPTFIPVDFDADDLADALEDARRFVAYLEVTWDVDPGALAYFFSGNKGYHIGLPTKLFGEIEPSPMLHRIVRGVMRDLLKGFDRADTSIYDRSRIFRIVNTRHSKSGRWKVQLGANNFLHEQVEDHLKYAETPAGEPGKFNPPDIEVKPVLRGKVKEAERDIEKADRHQQATTQTVLAPPKGEKPCIYKILAGVPAGERHDATMRLADYYRKKNLPPKMVLQMVQVWNADLHEPQDASEVKRLVKDVYEGGYDYGCNDPYLSRKCGSSCPHHTKTDLDHVKRVPEIKDSYIEYVRSFQDRKIDLARVFPFMRGKVRPFMFGQVVLIIAPTGVGKTAIAQNVALEMGVPTFYYTPEMPEEKMFERWVQQAVTGGMKAEQVEAHFLEKDHMSPKLAKKTEHIFVLDRPGKSLDDLRETIKALEEREGTKIQMVVIDHVGLLKSPFRDRFDSMAHVGKNIEEFAKETETVVVMLSQTSREKAGDGTKALGTGAAKDSGELENAADIEIVAWRPRMKNPAEDKEMMFKVRKNRNGPRNFGGHMLWDGELMKIAPPPEASTSDALEVEYDSE